MKKIDDVMLERIIELATLAGYKPSGKILKDALDEHIFVKFAYLIAKELEKE